MQDGSNNNAVWSKSRKPKRDFTLGTLWFVISLYCIIPLVQLVTMPLSGFFSFIYCIALFLSAKYWLNKTKECWFPK